MQIKVKESKPHLVIKNPIGGNEIEVQVAEAKLVLVECKPEEALLFQQNYNDSLTINHYSFEYGLVKGIGKYLKSILISETEKIEVGDKYLEKGKDRWFLETCNSQVEVDAYYHKIITGYKILALSEHFSPEHLQMIVDGKLKDGDKVLIECSNIKTSNETKLGEDPSEWFNLIKLNSSNHITFYPIEEKKYTREEVRSFLRDAICAGLYIIIDECDGWGEIDDEGFENWFEQNVK